MQLKTLLAEEEKTGVVEEKPEVVVSEGNSNKRNPPFITMFASNDNRAEEEGLSGSVGQGVSGEEDTAVIRHASEPLSSSYFLKSQTPRDKNLSDFCHSLIPSHLSPYQRGSPVFIGEVATGRYHQKSLLPSRSDLIWSDVGGVARNTYEAMLRQMPEKRPILIGVVGTDVEGKQVREFHRAMGDTLECVREEEGKTVSICGFYDWSGMKEMEFRYDDHVGGVSSRDIVEHGEKIENASLVFTDSSIEFDAMKELYHVMRRANHRLLLDPSETRNVQSLLDSHILNCTDFLLPSIDELWSLACLVKPALQSRFDAWNAEKESILRKRSDASFSDAILHLKEPAETVMGEMHKDKDSYVLLKMGGMGIAMIGREAGSSDVDVVHFTVEHNYTPTFESNIAYEEAFAGGFMSGLMMDYPLNLSMAMGINVEKRGRVDE